MMITSLLQVFYDLMESQPGLLLWPFVLLVVLPPTVLLHELGHAAMARWRAQDEVQLEVGSGPVAWKGRLAKIDLAIHPLVMPVGRAGSVSYDATRATAKDVLLVALAGPAASLLGTVITWVWFASAAEGSPLATVLATATYAGLFGTLINLVPMSISDRRHGPVTWRTDGWHALSAAKVLIAVR